MEKTGILVGSVLLGTEQILLEEMIHKENIYSVAVDGGIAFFLKHGIIPDYWIGDMDSVMPDDMQAVLAGKMSQDNFCRVPVMKDDTDMALAVEKAWKSGCEEILIFGGCGGSRVSHTLANIQLMLHYEKKGCHIRMISEHNHMEVLCNGIKAFSKEMKGLVSVFSLTDSSEDVVIEGLKYSYRGELDNDKALGVSNAFVGKESHISVGKGALLLIYEGEEETGENPSAGMNL